MSVSPGSLCDWVAPTPQLMLARHAALSLLLLK